MRKLNYKMLLESKPMFTNQVINNFLDRILISGVHSFCLVVFEALSKVGHSLCLVHSVN